MTAQVIVRHRLLRKPVVSPTDATPPGCKRFDGNTVCWFLDTCANLPPPHLTYFLLISPAPSSPHLPPPHLTYLLARWATLCSAELEWISQLEIAQLEISQLEISQLEGAEGAAAGLGPGSS